MRILLTTRGSAGHVGPLAPFARALEAVGHEVLVAAQRQHRAHVERLGLPFTPVGDPPDRAWRPLMAELPFLDADTANGRMVGDFFARIDTEAALPDLHRTVAAWRPDVILRDSWAFAATFVGEQHDIPVVRVALGLAEVEAWSIALAAPAVDRIRARLGLPRDPDGDRLRAQPLLTQLPAELDDPAVTPAPATVVHRFGEPQPAAPASSAAPTPPPLPTAWWPRTPPDAPLVYVSFGSITGGAGMPFFPRLYRDVLAALAPLPVRVLVTVGTDRDLGELGPLPPNAHAEPWIDQDVVLPHTAVLVGHGGHGTMLGGVRHGVPQVVLPLFSSDQWANAAAIARSGAGVAVFTDADRPGRMPLQLPTPDEVARVAAGVDACFADPSYTAHAQRLRTAIRALRPVDVAAPPVIAALARRARAA